MIWKHKKYINLKKINFFKNNFKTQCETLHKNYTVPYDHIIV